ncbi:MAG: hypothetical protein Q9204_004985 [Flavoplaca sp. TL-2023a]
MRKKRRSPITRYFHQIRDQAHNLHAALIHAWRCDDSPTHTAKLLLEKRVRSDKDGGHQIEDPASITFNVVFAHLGERSSDPSATRTSSDWCAAKVELLDIQPKGEHRESSSPIGGDSGSLIVCTSQHPSNATPQGTASSGTGERRIPFVTSMTELTTVSICDTEPEIGDLCSTIRSRRPSRLSLGYFKDAQHRRYNLSLAGPRQVKLANGQKITTLEDILGKKGSTVRQAILPRRSRLAIAVTLAHSMLQLHTGPWLHESWGKRDVHFLQDQQDNIQAERPFLVRQISTNDAESTVTSMIISRGCNTSLLSLGILILELWLNERIGAQPFYKQYQDQEGNDNEYTAFNAAQKWQEQAMEEAGLDLHNATRRCIYCAFGAASQDLEDEELRRAVYSEVVQPLEQLHSRF